MRNPTKIKLSAKDKKQLYKIYNSLEGTKQKVKALQRKIIRLLKSDAKKK